MHVWRTGRLHIGDESQMDLTLNLIGLLLITTGSIGAALSTPAPIYGPNGEVHSGPPDKALRIELHHRQRRLPWLLGAIGIGALLQAAAAVMAAA